MSARTNKDFMSVLERFKEFFEGSKKAFDQKDSDAYTRVKEQFLSSYHIIAKLQDERVTQENSMEMFRAGRNLTDACAWYLNINRNRRVYTGTGQKRRDAIRGVFSYLKRDYFGHLFEPDVIAACKDKTWREILR